MIRAALLLIPAALAAGGYAGWRSAAPDRAAAPTVMAGRQSAPGVSQPGRAAAAAAAALAARLAPAPSMDAAPPQPTARPPAPDVAAMFRAELAAVLRSDGRPRAVLASPEGRRILAEGDVFRDGWRVAAIGRGEIVLTHDGESRRIGLFAP